MLSLSFYFDPGDVALRVCATSSASWRRINPLYVLVVTNYPCLCSKIFGNLTVFGNLTGNLTFFVSGGISPLNISCIGGFLVIKFPRLCISGNGLIFFHISWIYYSWLIISFFQIWIFGSLSSGLQTFCWEIKWHFDEFSFLSQFLLFPGWFENFFFVINL